MRGLSVFVVALGLVSFGCGSPSSGGAAPEAASTAGSGGSGGGTTQADACSTCRRAMCATDVASCGSDPGCAARLECLEQCPSSGGAVDLACVMACPIPTTTQGQTAAAALDACAAESCVACGVGAGGQGGAGGAGTGGGAGAAGSGGGGGSAGASSSYLNEACPAAPNTNACYQCEDEKCCNVRAACHGDPNCQTTIDCAKACTTTSCIRDCLYKATDAAATEFNLLTDCVTYLCGIECGAMKQACSTCVEMNCADTQFACDQNPDCVRLGWCVGECGTSSSCYMQCQAKFPKGVADQNAFTMCGINKCGAQCGN